MVRCDLIHGGAEAEPPDARCAEPVDAEALEAGHIRIRRVVVDAPKQHRLELADRHIIALIACRRRVGKIVCDHVRVLGLSDHARRCDIESSPHSLSLFFPKHIFTRINFAVRCVFPSYYFFLPKVVFVAFPSNLSKTSSALPQPSATQDMGSSATTVGVPVSL